MPQMTTALLIQDDGEILADAEHNDHVPGGQCQKPMAEKAQDPPSESESAQKQDSDFQTVLKMLSESESSRRQFTSIEEIQKIVSACASTERQVPTTHNVQRYLNDPECEKGNCLSFGWPILRIRVANGEERDTLRSCRWPHKMVSAVVTK